MGPLFWPVLFNLATEHYSRERKGKESERRKRDSLNKKEMTEKREREKKNNKNKNKNKNKNFLEQIKTNLVKLTINLLNIITIIIINK